MKYFVLIILLLIAACSSLQMNGPEVRKACKSGVLEYDDGTVSFKCDAKEKDND